MTPKQHLLAKAIFIVATMLSLAMIAFVAWAVVTVSPLHPADMAPSQRRPSRWSSGASSPCSCSPFRSVPSSR